MKHLMRFLFVVLLIIVALILINDPQARPAIPLPGSPKPTTPPIHQGHKPDALSYYVTLARQDAADAGISPDLFVRQINEESGFNPNAVSPHGAIGIAQFMAATAAGLGINPWDPVQSLRGAARLMASYARKYGSYAMALAAYNAGSARVQAALNACGGNWQSCLPAETQAYIRIIFG